MRRPLNMASSPDHADEGYEVLASRTAHKPGFRRKTWLLRAIGLCVLTGGGVRQSVGVLVGYCAAVTCAVVLRVSCQVRQQVLAEEWQHSHPESLTNTTLCRLLPHHQRQVPSWPPPSPWDAKTTCTRCCCGSTNTRCQGSLSSGCCTSCSQSPSCLPPF